MGRRFVPASPERSVSIQAHLLMVKKSVSGLLIIAMVLWPVACQDGPAPTSISLEHVVSLGDHSDPALFTVLTRLARGPGGEFVAAPTYERGQLSVYDSAGEHLKVVGRYGRGPNEFRRPFRAVVAGDTIYVADRSSLQVSAITLDGDAARSFGIQARALDLIIVSDTILAVSGQILGQGYVSAQQIRTVSTTGRFIADFGNPGADTLHEQSRRFQYLAPGADGTIWSLKDNQYELTQWTPNGDVVHRLRFQPQWFEPFEEYIPPNHGPPSTYLYDLETDAQGLLWIFGQVSPHWEASEDLRRGEQVITVDYLNTMFDTMVEVVNPLTGDLVARQQFSRMLYPVDGDHVFAFSQDEVGLIRIHIFRLVLDQAKQ